MADQGMTWIETALAGGPHGEFRGRLRQELERRIRMLTMTGMREGFTTVTPYLTTPEIEPLVNFIQDAFGGVETGRTATGPGRFHIEMQVGDSMLMCGGGPGAANRPAALHFFVPNVDEVYTRALAAGAESLYIPEDKPYGERGAGVKDAAGNYWFIATSLPGVPQVEGRRTLTPYLLAKNALGLIEFLKHALGATEIGIHKSPEGNLLHGALRIGDAVVEMGEAEAMPSAFYLYVPDVDTLYRQALEAGAKSLYPPADQWYGDRSCGLEDAWGHTWYIATHLG